MARDLVQVAVAPQKAAETASVFVNEARMLTRFLTSRFTGSRAPREE